MEKNLEYASLLANGLVDDSFKPDQDDLLGNALMQIQKRLGQKGTSELVSV